MSAPPAADDRARPGATPDSVGQLLAAARAELQNAGADSPSLTALVLLEYATGIPRTALLAHPGTSPNIDLIAVFHDLLQRRCAREPLAYILGYRDFYGRRFAVSPDVLIPRPETEGLVALALDRLDRFGGEGTASLLDVGTGSGAIAISVLAERPNARAAATDSSCGALAIARQNARAHGVSPRLQLVACDLVSAIRTRFPVVVANLPYVPSAECDALEPEVAKWEPRSALDGGADGTVLIHRFLTLLDGVLTPGGSAILEMSSDQAEPLARCAADLLPRYSVNVQRDHAGADRFLAIGRPGRPAP